LIVGITGPNCPFGYHTLVIGSIRDKRKRVETSGQIGKPAACYDVRGARKIIDMGGHLVKLRLIRERSGDRAGIAVRRPDGASVAGWLQEIRVR